MSRRGIQLMALARVGSVLALGLSTGGMMVLSSTSYAPFSPVPIIPPILYAMMAITGAWIAYLYREVSHMALAAALALLTAAACLGLALSLGLQWVGWALTVDVFLTMVGVHLVSYAFAMAIFQTMGAFIVLMIRRS